MQTFAHPSQLRHTPQFFLQRGQVRANFEVPERAGALLSALHRLGLVPAEPDAATREALLSVHDAGYVDFLESAARGWNGLQERGPEAVPNMHPSPEMLAQGAVCPESIIGRVGWYTADNACPIGTGTWEAAAGAAGVALAAADSVAKGGTAYALCRPPGHHAYAGRAGGHCYLNNSALAAQRLRDAGANRVATLDIDAHHGNGTQGIFWDRADVLTVSVHGDPSGYYPWYVGHAGETGGGAGQGFNLNLPLRRGSSDEAWLAAIDAGLERIKGFAPDALVVPLGFDASEHEPLSFLGVSADGFARAAEKISALGLPTVLVQEGGYNVEVLGTLLERFLTAWKE
ncbi:histone deacetylase family protein [Pseudoroseomonas wenyumeiae]|uniref:Histone deacetylase family protein n=1 Tax=Teichococcus wenyumeiae TaxID=2478470 RepID=A0A3A9JKA0_9PROT|nr:histone deacetylase family protein [Pseudoroseomonas wenyumeiae]RKK04985.1 histone deacetylase family protein [Pseudoroseomonas wenyumeiae]RMI26041.1 histone deacetylase family protein [Pseudoroseomonas wenyumeiae]